MSRPSDSIKYIDINTTCAAGGAEVFFYTANDTIILRRFFAETYHDLRMAQAAQRAIWRRNAKRIAEAQR